MTRRNTTIEGWVGVLLGLWLLGFGSCGGNDGAVGADGGALDGGGQESGGGVGGFGGGAGADQDIGGFDIQLVPAAPATEDTPAVPAQTALLGALLSGPVPARTQWMVMGTEGDCQLEIPRIPFCNPACGSGSACTADGVCSPEPSPRSAGTVSLTGLVTESGPTELTLEPQPPKQVYQLPLGVTLAYPPFAPGDPVTLRAEGGEVGAFSLTAAGISPFAFTAEIPPVTDGQPIPLSWTPASVPAGGRIHLSVDLSVHAGTKGRIECSVPDTGLASVPAALVSALMALGTSGFPKIVATRSSVGLAGLPSGRVRLTIFSEVQRTVRIAGQIDCVDDVDCPSGQTCQPALFCR